MNNSQLYPATETIAYPFAGQRCCHTDKTAISTAAVDALSNHMHPRKGTVTALTEAQKRPIETMTVCKTQAWRGTAALFINAAVALRTGQARVVAAIGAGIVSN